MLPIPKTINDNRMISTSANPAFVEPEVTQTKRTSIKAPTSVHQRLYSLDALRGFDMFWIMGAEAIFHTLAKATGSPFWGTIGDQFTHPEWNGFHLYDLIFPLLLFMAGEATPF